MRIKPQDNGRADNDGGGQSGQASTPRIVTTTSHVRYESLVDGGEHEGQASSQRQTAGTHKHTPPPIVAPETGESKERKQRRHDDDTDDVTTGWGRGRRFENEKNDQDNKGNIINTPENASLKP